MQNLGYLFLNKRKIEEAFKSLQVSEQVVYKCIIIHERREIMEFFLRMTHCHMGMGKSISIKKTVCFMKQCFDFRNVRNPKLPISTKSLETELYKLMKELKEKSTSR